MNDQPSAEQKSKPRRTKRRTAGVTEREHSATTVARTVVKKEMLKVPERQDSSVAYACRFLKGGKKELIELAKLSDHPAVCQVVVEYSKLAARRQREPNLIERLCDGVDISASTFLAEVVKAAFDTNIDIGKLVLAVSHPRVLQQAVKQALTAGGVRDRQMLLEASGTLKKPGISVKAIAAAQAAARAESGSFEERCLDLSKEMRED